MATKADRESKTVVKKLALFMLGFYFIYYLWGIILIGGLKVDWDELGRYPFRIRLSEFSPSEQGKAALGAWLAMVLTYTLCIILTFYIVKVTKMSWDYIASTSILHLILCIIINQAFPVNWVWWITILISSAVLMLASEVAIYQLRELREIKLENV